MRYYLEETAKGCILLDSKGLDEPRTFTDNQVARAIKFRLNQMETALDRLRRYTEQKDEMGKA